MDEANTRHTIKIKPAKIALSLLSVSLVIMILSIIGQRFRFLGGYRISGPVEDYLLDMYIYEFFVNNEGNIATYWNTFILIIMAVLTIIIASAKFAQKDGYRYEWWLLGAVYLYLSMDESSVIHEKFSALLKNMPDVNGWAHYKWLYAGAAAVIFLTVVFIRFYLHLDLRNKILFPVSMALYLLGAFGGELFSGHYAQYYGTKNITYTFNDPWGGIRRAYRDHFNDIYTSDIYCGALLENRVRIAGTRKSIWRFSMEKPRHTIKINPAKVALSLLGVSFVIIIFSLIGQREYQVSNPIGKFFLDMYTKEFYVNSGANIATYWNMLILIFMAVLAFVIASVKLAQKDKYRYEWWLLGAVFFYFAMDELSSINQKVSTLFKDLPNMEGGANYYWFYPVAAAFIVVTLVLFIRFYFHLDAPNKVLFPISITLYILGAFRAELFSGYYAELYGKKTFTYMLMTHAEEFIEHVGVILMIYMLLTYIKTHYSEIEFMAQEPKKTI